MLATFNIGTMVSQENQIKNIPISSLVSYHNHKFKLYSGERLEDMVESVKQNGILVPIIVQPVNDGEEYEILSGHNRTNAAKLAGLTTVPAVVKEHLSADEAEMYVIETNLSQRGFNDLRISEQAAVLAMRHSKMFTEEKRQAINAELQALDGSFKSKLEQTGEEYGLKKDTVARLLRIDKIIEPMKAWVDEKQLAVRSAVELSYIPPETQKMLYELLADKSGNMTAKLDTKKAKAIRVTVQANPEISEDELLDIITDEEKERKEFLKLPSDVYEEYFKKHLNNVLTDKQKIAVIKQALSFYFENSPMANKTK